MGRERGQCLLNRRRRGRSSREEGRMGPPLLRCDVRRNNFKADGWLDRCSKCRYQINDGRVQSDLNDQWIADILPTYTNIGINPLLVIHVTFLNELHCMNTLSNSFSQLMSILVSFTIRLSMSPPPAKLVQSAFTANRRNTGSDPGSTLKALERANAASVI